MADKKIIKKENGVIYFENDEYLDLSGVPLARNGLFDWKNATGVVCKFRSNGVDGTVLIENAIDAKELYVNYDGFTKKFAAKNFATLKFGNLINKINRTTKGDYTYEIGEEIHNDKRDCIIIDRKIETIIKARGVKEYYGDDRYYKVRCLRCGYECGEYYKKGEKYEEYWVAESSLTKTSCAVCCKFKQFVVPHINSIVSNKETMWMVDYFEGDTHEERYELASHYTYNSEQQIELRCPICRTHTTRTAISNLYYSENLHCPNCSDTISFPNKVLYILCKMLIENNLIYEYEYEFTPDWCRYTLHGKQKTGSYDGKFITKAGDNRIIVEMDGGLGHGKNKHSSSKVSIEDSLQMDIEKDIVANNNGYKVIRIDCDYSTYTKYRFDFIKNNIINSELNTYFDLSIINWIDLYIEAIGSYKNNIVIDYNNGMQIKDIVNIYPYSYAIIKLIIDDAISIGMCKES